MQRLTVEEVAVRAVDLDKVEAGLLAPVNVNTS
jgi:hypothetical protein